MSSLSLVDPFAAAIRRSYDEDTGECASRVRAFMCTLCDGGVRLACPNGDSSVCCHNAPESCSGDGGRGFDNLRCCGWTAYVTQVWRAPAAYATVLSARSLAQATLCVMN